jgi:hypothetical protein
MGKFSDSLLEEVKSYTDTEWTGALGKREITLVAKPITPADMTIISRAHPDFGRSPSMEGMVDLIIHKARDPADNQKAFDRGDKPLVMKLGTDKIAEIFTALFGKQMVEDSDEEFEDRMGNSKKTTGG